MDRRVGVEILGQIVRHLKGLTAAVEHLRQELQDDAAQQEQKEREQARGFVRRA